MNTVLIVDDQQYNRELIRRYLLDWGYSVLWAKNGQEALSVARSSRPHLILMDLRMPVMDGWQAQTELARDEETRRIPVVALTADLLDDNREKILSLGFRAFEEKPIKPNSLKETIRKLLEAD